MPAQNVSQLLVVQHLEREGPGLLSDLARQRGLSVRILRPYAGEPLPAALAAHQLLAHAAEPVLEGLPASLLVLHWHGDRIALPPAATLLASSLPCPEQIFRLGPRAFGLQCHIEVDAASLERWIRDDQAFVQAALGPGGAERIRSDRARWLAGATPLWRRLLDNLLVACLA